MIGPQLLADKKKKRKVENSPSNGNFARAAMQNDTEAAEQGLFFPERRLNQEIMNTG